MSEVITKIMETPFYAVVSRFIEDHDLFRGVHHLHLAYSGGADSTALLAFLAAWLKGRNMTMTAHHIRHGLRENDAIDAELAANNAARFHVPFIQTDLQLGALASNVEAVARQSRQRALEQAIDPSILLQAAIVTAHHGDENVETALWRMGRGCGLEGLALSARTSDAIPRIRPLLCVGKREIFTFLRELEIPWAEDPTNAGDHYRRNRLRHRVLAPLMDEFENMAPLYRSLIHLHADADALSCLGEREVLRSMFGNRWVYPVAEFDALSDSAKIQLLRHAARHILPGYCPTAAFIEKTCRILSQRRVQQKKSTDERITWIWNRDFVMGEPHDAQKTFTACDDVTPAADERSLWGLAQVSMTRLICVDVPKNTRTRLFLNASAILGELRFVPAHRLETIKTSDGRIASVAALLHKARIPDVLHHVWPVLTDHERPLWILAGPRSIFAVPPAPMAPALCIEIKSSLFLEHRNFGI